MKRRVSLSALVFLIIVSMASLSLTQNAYAVNTAMQKSVATNATDNEDSRMFAHVGASGNPIDDFLSVANAQKGKKAADYGFNDNWCAWFVCWCGRVAGLDGKGYFPKSSIGRVTDLCNWFVDNNKGKLYYADPGEVHISKNAQKISKNNFIPQKGDLICFLWDPKNTNRRYNHVGIVSGYSNGTVYYIDGNTGSTGSWRTNYVKTNHTINRTSQSITAYLRPNYGGTAPKTQIEGYNIRGPFVVYPSSVYNISVESFPGKASKIVLYFENEAGQIIGTHEFGASIDKSFAYPPIGRFCVYADVIDAYGHVKGSRDNGAIWITGKEMAWGNPANLGSGFTAYIQNTYAGTVASNDNTNVSGRNLNYGANQLWDFERLNDGSYKIVSKMDNKCLSVVRGGGYYDGAEVIVSNYTGADDQKWFIYDNGNGGYYLRPKCSNSAVLDLDNANSANGTNIHIWTSNSGNTQRFNIIKYTPHTTCVWDSGKLTKAATCTRNGTRTYTCTVCKKTKTSEIPATGHKGGTANCMSKAKCSTCGASYGNYGNHQYSTDWTMDKAASCVTAGSKSHHCKYCDAKKDVTSIPATGHSWDEGTVLRQATEITTGLKSYTCYNCGATKTETLSTIEKEEDDITLVRKITLSHTNAKLLCGDTLQLTSTVAPADADNKTVVWTSSAESIITVSSTGLVKAVSPGGAMIFCTAIDGSGVKGSCSITVLPNDIPDVTMPPSEPEVSDDSEDDEEDYENEELEEGDMLTDPKSDADYEIIELQNGMGTVKYLGSNANTKTIKIPETITVYGVTYKVTSIGEGAFEDDRNVTQIIIGNNITNIERNAFKGCSKLTSVVIGNNVTQIGDKAFYKCKKLTKITIPSKVTKIGKQAFYGCKRLKSITIKTTKLTSKTIGSKAFKGTYERAMVKVPKSKLKIYQKILKEKGIGAKAKIRK